jgi:putative SOS response-associated peptidase YedK
MPVILRREDERIWLQNGLERDNIQSMLQSYNTDKMEAYPVPRLVNKIGFNTENQEVTARQEYPDLPD